MDEREIYIVMNNSLEIWIDIANDRVWMVSRSVTDLERDFFETLNIELF